MDPTILSLKKLDDPAQYVRVDNLPIFKPHRRKTQDGRVVSVTSKDLGTICQHAKDTYQKTGVPIRLTPGHIIQDRSTPETRQPPTWGWAVDPRPGKFGPKGEDCILATAYIRKDRWQEAKEYPYRSAEFYPDSLEITGVALLRRDPELDLGVVTYTREATCYHYSMENTMPDDLNMPGAAPGGMPGDGDGDEGYQQFENYVKKHKVLNYVCDKYADEAMGAPGPGMGGDLGGGMPPPPPGEPGMGNTMTPDDQAMGYQRAGVPVQYARQLAAVQAENRKLKHDNDMLAYARELTRLRDHGVVFDHQEEMARGSKLSGEARREQLRVMATHYSKSGTAASTPWIPTAEPERSDKGRELSREQRDRAVQYMTDKECSWGEAMEHVKANP